MTSTDTSECREYADTSKRGVVLNICVRTYIYICMYIYIYTFNIRDVSGVGNVR